MTLHWAPMFLFSILRFLFFSQISLAFFMWKFRLAYLRSWPNFAVFYYFVFPRRTKKNRNEGSKQISILSNLSLRGRRQLEKVFTHTRFSRFSARYAMRSDWLIDARLNAWLSIDRFDIRGIRFRKHHVEYFVIIMCKFWFWQTDSTGARWFCFFVFSFSNLNFDNDFVAGISKEFRRVF